MNLISLLINIIGSALDIVIINYYFKLVFGEARFNNVKVRLLCFMLFILMSISTTIASNPITVSIISIIIISLMSFLYKSSNSKRVLNVLILVTIIILSEAITGMTSALITNKNVDFLISNDIYYLQGVLISKTILFILLKFIHNLVFNSNENTSKSLTLAFMTIPISTIFLIYIISDYAVELRESRSIALITLSVLLFEKAHIVNGNIATTKKDKALHGFGISSIKEIVRKHNGHVTFDQRDNYFFVNIYMINPIANPILQI